MPKHKKAEAIVQMLREQRDAETRLSEAHLRKHRPAAAAAYRYTATVIDRLIDEAEKSLHA